MIDEAVAVVVLDVPMDDGFEVASAKDEHPVQTFTSDSADGALSEGVCTGRPDRCSDRPDAIGPENLVESGSELGVATRIPSLTGRARWASS